MAWVAAVTTPLLLASATQPTSATPPTTDLGEAAARLGKGPAINSEFLSIEFGGRTRDAVLYVPPGAPAGAALPLVFNYHGYGSDGLQQVFYSFNVSSQPPPTTTTTTTTAHPFS